MSDDVGNVFHVLFFCHLYILFGEMSLMSFAHFLIVFFFSFFGHAIWQQDLSSQPGIERASPAVEVQSLNHWTTREVPVLFVFILLNFDFFYIS